MSVFKNIWKRHRNKLIWSIGISGVIYLGSCYVKQKWNTLNQQFIEEFNSREQ
jgi:hypothetical protein